MTGCYLVDVDGTIALRAGRGPHDYDQVAFDVPREPVVAILRTLAVTTPLVFASGRPASCRRDTHEWISRHLGVTNPVLHMRTTGDYRADDVVKREIYEQDIRPAWTVLAVFDDRDRVVTMWRDLGLTCLQVAPGDF